MIWHPRSEWQDPRYPVTGPRIDWPNIDTVAIHYTAADDLIDGDLDENWAGLPAYLRQIQRSYLNRQPTGYSIGYNVGVDARGDAWELRGFDISCAANKGHNDHTWAILVLVDGPDPASVEAQKTIRQLILEAEGHAKRELAIKGHCQLPSPTACPGRGLLGQIDGGVFSPRFDPQPITDPEEDDMAIRYIRHGKYGAVYGCFGNAKTWIDDGDGAAAALARAGVVAPDDVDETTCVSYGPILGPIPANHDVYGRVLS